MVNLQWYVPLQIASNWTWYNIKIPLFNHICIKKIIWKVTSLLCSTLFQAFSWSCSINLPEFSVNADAACFLKAECRFWIIVSSVNQSCCGFDRSSIRITVRVFMFCAAAASGADSKVGNKVPPPSSQMWQTSFTWTELCNLYLKKLFICYKILIELLILNYY